MIRSMRLAGFGTALTLVFGAAWGIGTVTGIPTWPSPNRVVPPPLPAKPQPAEPQPAPPADSPPADSPPADSQHRHGHQAGPNTQGLAATAAGYTLAPQVGTFVPGTPGELAFAVLGSDARPVRAFEPVGEQRMHVVVVRRDAAGFQHLLPELGPDGVWRAPLTLPAAGTYRLYADFTPTGGPALVLGADLFAEGEFAPVRFGPARVAQVDSYQVRLDGDLAPGAPSQIFATISRNGSAVTDLQPYLGAFGHLVVLRRGDLAYTRVPPDAARPAATDRSGPGIAFTARVPTAGGYRLFLEFRHDGVARTAEFTVDTRDGA